MVAGAGLLAAARAGARASLFCRRVRRQQAGHDRRHGQGIPLGESALLAAHQRDEAATAASKSGPSKAARRARCCAAAGLATRCRRARSVTCKGSCRRTARCARTPATSHSPTARDCSSARRAPARRTSGPSNASRNALLVHRGPRAPGCVSGAQRSRVECRAILPPATSSASRAHPDTHARRAHRRRSRAAPRDRSSRPAPASWPRARGRRDRRRASADRRCRPSRRHRG